MRALRRKRIYFAKYASKLPGKPDVVFRRKRLVVFIDSDFWHGHPRRGAKPKTNRGYWKRKIETNKKRDRLVRLELRRQGWRVLRLWEFDVKHHLDHELARIIAALQQSKDA